MNTFVTFPEGLVTVKNGWFVVICHGCSLKHENKSIRGECHLFRNLEYLEWCHEKRLAL